MQSSRNGEEKEMEQNKKLKSKSKQGFSQRTEPGTNEPEAKQRKSSHISNFGLNLITLK